MDIAPGEVKFGEVLPMMSMCDMEDISSSQPLFRHGVCYPDVTGGTGA